jgi:Holliday junction resolvasome RuvABC DNA-binding subunit
MIAQIEGKLVKLDAESCLVQVGSICYEVMLPGYCVSALSGRVGSEVTLCTMEYYEGTLGGGNLVPRMIGFLNSGERDFFTRYISVKGMGIKKGLRSLSIPIATIASTIENGDDKTLMSLPAVGRTISMSCSTTLNPRLLRRNHHCSRFRWWDVGMNMLASLPRWNMLAGEHWG